MTSTPTTYEVELGGVLVVQALPSAIAANVEGVGLTLTAANATADSYLTAHPCGVVPDGSTVNYVVVSSGHLATSNATFVPIGADGRLCVTASAPTDVVVDITAVFQ